MQITIAIEDTNRYDVFAKTFSNVEEIVVVHKSIFDIKGMFDAIVSPANSFGIMDGGIDKIYIQEMGILVEKNAQKMIKNSKFQGELPIGEALSVETGIKQYKNMIIAPTMRIPEDVSNTINAYTAFRATLIEASLQGYSTLITPTFCTGIGKMPSYKSATQMYMAHRILQRKKDYTYEEIHRIHKILKSGEF